MTADEYLDGQIGPPASASQEPQNAVMTADQYIDSQIGAPAAAETASAAAPGEKPSGIGAGLTTLNAFPSGVVNSGVDTALGATQAIAEGLNKLGVLPDALNVGGTDYGYKAGSAGINDIKAMKDEEMAEALKGNVPAQIAEGAGNIAGNIAQYSALPGEGVIAAGLKGLGLGAAQPVQDGQTTVLGVPVDNRLLNSGVSGAAALVGQKLGDILSTEVKDPNLANVMKTASDNDIPVYRNQTSDSRFMKAMAGVLKNVPGGGGGAAAEDQVGAFNKAVNATIGQPDEPVVNSTVLGKAAQDIGKVYDSVKQYPLLDSPDFQTKLNVLQKDAQVNTVGDQRDMVNQQIANLRDNLSSGQMTGDAAKQTISNLGTVARGANTSPQLRQLRSLVNQQWASTMAPEDAQALQTADQQWRNLVALDGPVSRNPNGPISPTAVQAGVKNVSSDYSRDGGGQLGNLSRLGQLMGKNFPDSGTAANEKIMDMLKHVGTAAAVGGGGAYMADSEKESGPVRALRDLGGAGAAILAARYGISPYVFSKMGVAPSAASSAAPGALAGLTNYFQSRPIPQQGASQ